MQPLTGIRVIDLSQLLPGPFCSVLLADLGAEVIKVERPGGGDYIRTLLPGMFWTANRNKKSICIDLKSTAGRDVIYRLVQDADVVIEGFRPGVVNRLSLDYDSLRQIKSSIVYCSISGYGQEGPYSQVPGHDINYLSMGGGLSIPGDIEYPPIRPGLPIGDLSSAMYAALSIVAAVYSAKQTGVGDFLDVSITDCIVAWSSVRFGEYMRDGIVLSPEQMPHLSPGNKIFETADGKQIALAALEDKFWENLCRAITKEEWLKDASLKTNELRNKNQNSIPPKIKESLKKKSLEEWLSIFREYDVPSSPVYGIAEVFQDSHLQARGIFHNVSIEEEDTKKQIGFPVKFRNITPEIRRAPVDPGEDTIEVLNSFGFGQVQIESLKENGVIS